MNISTGSVPAVNSYFVREMLKTPRSYLIHRIPLTEMSMPSRNSTTMTLREHADLAIQSVANAEGVPPAEAAISYGDITATLLQYINWVEMSDQSVTTSLEALKAVYAEKLGWNMGESIDTIDRDVLLGGTSAYFANAVANRAAVITAIAEADLTNIDRLLFENKARYFKGMATGSNKTGTSPIRAAYICLCHGNLKADVEGLTGYRSVEEYASQVEPYESEWGSWRNFRFIGSQNCQVYADSGAAVGASGLISTTGVDVDVYPMLIFGQDAARAVKLDELTTDLIISDFGDDRPAHQTMTMAWKYFGSLAIVHEDLMVRYEVGATA